jgi:hypothetical protein
MGGGDGTFLKTPPPHNYELNCQTHLPALHIFLKPHHPELRILHTPSFFFLVKLKSVLHRSISAEMKNIEPILQNKGFIKSKSQFLYRFTPNARMLTCVF